MWEASYMLPSHNTNLPQMLFSQDAELGTRGEVVASL